MASSLCPAKSFLLKGINTFKMTSTGLAVVATQIGAWRDVLSLEPPPSPCPPPGDGELQVRVHSCGLAFPDVLTVEGKHIQKKQPPFVPATEVAGIVTAVGKGVTEAYGFREGDRVFGTTNSGGLRKYTTIPAMGAYKLPEGVGMNVGAGFELNYGTTYHGLVDISRLREGETLLVLGASGGVGMAAIDIGVALGATVVACASTPAKLEVCEKAGATTLINYTEGNFKQALKDAGVYGCVDVVYDPVGGEFSETAMRSLGWGGRHVVIGFAAGGANPKSAIPRLPLNLALLNEREILGCFWGAWKFRDGNEMNRKNIERCLEMVRSGKLNPVVSQTYALKDYASAFEAMMSRRVVGKITIKVGDEETTTSKL